MSPRIVNFDHSLSLLNVAGEAFRGGDYDSGHLDILTQWRKLNASELSNIRSTINSILKRAGVDKADVLISQRLKRLPTIIDKLKRFPSMKLSRMQDISGIRIVCKDMGVLAVVSKALDVTKFEKRNDYLTKPIESGYRGIHYTRQLESKARVELQLRTELQHAWATAVEISDVLHPAEGILKTNKNITSDRARFFKLTSSLMALEEFTPRYLDIRTNDLLDEIKELESKHKISQEVEIYSPALVYVEQSYSGQSILVIAMADNGATGSIYTFKSEDAEAAVQKYQRLESDDTFENVVLVKSSGIKKLRQAYPNYFGGAELFKEFIDSYIATPKSEE